MYLQQIGNTGNPPNYVQPTVGVTNQPAVVNPTPAPANPPAYTPSAQQQVTTAEFQVGSHCLKGPDALCNLLSYTKQLRMNDYLYILHRFGRSSYGEY